ncbi:MAG: ParB/RepB/Spo0J family partition protein [Candidatus Puniceispirillaceae bacterium]|jgi:ParB family chromosome partitioning protein
MSDKKKNRTQGTKRSGNPAPNRGLGRGLSSLLGDVGVAAAAGIAVPKSDAPAPAPDRLSGLSEIPIEWINTGPWQPRRVFAQDALAELADSIRQKGIVQPILVRPSPDRPTRFELIAGERRWRAAQLAQLHMVPAIVRDFTDAQAYEIALIENVQRADLSAIEEAQGYQKLLAHHDYTQEQLSEIIGKSRSHIANLLRLLTLPETVQDMVMEGLLSMGQVRPIINHKDCMALARQIVKKGLSARQVEALVKKGDGSRVQTGPPEKSANIRDLEEKASTATGVNVTIEWDENRDIGSVHLKNCSHDQLENILVRLGVM